MRIVGSVSLAIAATLAGLFGALMLGLSGLTLAGPGLTVIEYSDSDDSERSIGIGMDIIALVVWLMLLSSALVTGLRGGDPTRGRHTTAWVIVALGTAVVLVALTAVLATPHPTSEYPLLE